MLNTAQPNKRMRPAGAAKYGRVQSCGGGVT